MEIIIKPKSRWWTFDWKEILRFKDLFYYLTWRDVKVKYKQTSVGVLWAIFQPFISMVIFTVFFGKLAQIPSDGIPYPIFVYTGLLFWTLFSSGLAQASDSFVANEKIVTKIYFPRIILPISSIVTHVVDFFFAAIILGGLMLWYKVPLTLFAVLLTPLLLLLTIVSAVGIGLLFASINVKYRDVRFVLPFFIQLMLFVTPVIYPVSIVSDSYRWILGLNPMSGVIDAARTGILGTGEIDVALFGTSVVMMVVYCLLGYFYFKKTERYFADVI